MEVKKIALIVASIVLIGTAIVFITDGWLDGVIGEVWGWMWDSIKGWFTS